MMRAVALAMLLAAGCTEEVGKDPATTERAPIDRFSAAAGTLFGNQFLRLVQVGPFRLDTYLDGTLLLFPHRDVPGLIGHVGTIFGRHGVNIARMAVGREANMPGGEAIGVLNLDSEPSAEALEQVKAHPHIHALTLVKLPPAGELPVWL